MAQGGDEKKTRIYFACERQGDGVPLLNALSKAPKLAVEEFFGSPNDIFTNAVAKSADLVILLFSGMTKEHEKCVSRILRGTFSHVLLLTGGETSGDLFADDSRVTVWRIPGADNSFDIFAAKIVSLCEANRRPAHKPAATHTHDANHAPAASPAPTAANTPAPVRALTVIKTAKPAVGADSVFSSKLLAIGASTGGTEAIYTLLSGLKPNIPGIVVVQHMPPVFTEMFALRLNRELPFEVTEAKDNAPIKPGTIHVAPGDRHLMVKKVGGTFYTVLGGTKKVGGHCPAVNVLFSSVAKAAGSAATGVILTGMGSDGAEGMLEMKNRGAMTIGQDEKSSVVYGMPRRAFELGAVNKQAPLTEIASLIMAHIGTV